MKVEFTGRHIEVSTAVKKHTQEHLDKLDKVFDIDKLSKAHVILEVEKHRHRAEIIFRWREQEITVKAETDDMYTAITQAAEKLERQALKFKDKKTNQKRQVKSKLVAEKIEAAESEPTPAVVEASKEVKIVASQRYAAKPMSSEEAALELRQSDDHFLVFRDGKTEKIAVIYKRKNGDFGLIEP